MSRYFLLALRSEILRILSLFDTTQIASVMGNSAFTEALDHLDPDLPVACKTPDQASEIFNQALRVIGLVKF